jgi:hypothetical protein
MNIHHFENDEYETKIRCWNKNDNDKRIFIWCTTKRIVKTNTDSHVCVCA